MTLTDSSYHRAGRAASTLLARVERLSEETPEAEARHRLSRGSLPDLRSQCPRHADCREPVGSVPYHGGMILPLTLLLLGGSAQPPSDTEGWLGRSAELALACVHREYPNKISHVLNSDADVRAPRELTPAFYGCYDWHSSVHGHWLLARVARLHADAPFASRARAALDKSLTVANIAAEVRYLDGPGRVSFERPYGLAWLLQLHAELHEWAAERPADAAVRKWAGALEPLTRAAISRIADWLPKLTAPIRIGEHSQTAFSFGLMVDWARATDDRTLASLLESRSRDFYLNDRRCPIAYEPSGEDFLSPCVAEADLMRRVLPQAEFTRWLRDFLPSLPTDGREKWLAPGVVTDSTDPKLGHLYGLNLSRAWMLHAISNSLPASDPRRAALMAAARIHRTAGMTGVTGNHYEGGHWLGTFAVYLETGRGLPAPGARR